VQAQVDEPGGMRREAGGGCGRVHPGILAESPPAPSVRIDKTE
jgi:hypothetical protein